MSGGRHFLQIPGPTNVPDRILRAMDRPTIDHRGPEFAAMATEALAGLRGIVGTEGELAVYPSSGTGAWEAALVNTLSPGDTVVMYETGHFAALWSQLAQRLGLQVELLPGDWRHPVDPEALRRRLAGDSRHAIRAVAVVHNETSTAVASDIPAVRAALDETGHPALLLVDTISSLGSLDYAHDDWGVDVTVGCSQKGLMLPPGLGFNAISAKARAAAADARLPRAYWDWEPMIAANTSGFFPSTPATNLLFGLREAAAMLREEGMAAVLARHRRHAEAARRAVRAWDLELLCLDEGAYSPALTAVVMPEGHNADRLREVILRRFDMSLGAGLGKLSGTVFRIGHLGALNDLSLIGTLGGVEAGLRAAGVPHRAGGVGEAVAFLADTEHSR